MFTPPDGCSPGSSASHRRVYPVPWHISRGDPRHPRLTNIGSEVLDTVRGFVSDRHGSARTDRWGVLQPGDSVQLCLCAADVASTIVTLAWYRPGTDEEYLWRFVV